MVAYVTWLAYETRGIVFVVALATPTFVFYGVGTVARKRGRFSDYALFHSLWHLSSGLVAAYVLLHSE